MKRVQLIMPDELLTKLDEHCKKYSYERSEYVRGILRTKLFGSTPDEPKVGEQSPNKVNVPYYPEPDEIAELTSQPIVAPCTYEHCLTKRPQPLKEVTYLDDDQTRLTGLLCQSCISKAKTTGMFIGEGDLL